MTGGGTAREPVRPPAGSGGSAGEIPAAAVKPWGGRFGEEAGRAAERFTASLPFDRRLYRQDLAGSRAHVRMLAAGRILTREEADLILGGLDAVERELEEGTFPYRIEYEDIHLNVERRLAELVGPVAGKLHTARSRNDQVALDMHLYMKEEIPNVQAGVASLQAALVRQARAHLDAPAGPTLMPGYTHLQRAQPVLLSHHLLAYFWMLQRDRERLADCLRRTDVSPLGAAALAGTPWPIDRRRTAAELGLAGVYPNSMDAVSDRDFLLEFLACAAILMVHLSRLGEEMVLWASREFGFVELPEAYATGSSIMPQKKNPDVAELVRGKAGRVFGHLTALLAVMKGLPLAYHSDMQEDKEAVFDALDTVKACLGVTAGLVDNLRFRADRMRTAVAGDLSNATDLADELARRGMPFREAHALAGRVVRHCLEAGCGLEDLTLAQLRALVPGADEGLLAALRPEAVVAARRSEGGTAPERVREQLALAESLLGRAGGLAGTLPAREPASAEQGAATDQR